MKHNIQNVTDLELERSRSLMAKSNYAFGLTIHGFPSVIDSNTCMIWRTSRVGGEEVGGKRKRRKRRKKITTY